MSEVGPRHSASAEVFRSAARQDGWPLGRNNFKRPHEALAGVEPMEVEDLSVKKEGARSTPVPPLSRSPYLPAVRDEAGVDLSASSRWRGTPPSISLRHKVRGAEDIIVLSDEEANGARLNGHHAHLNGSPGLEQWEAPKRRRSPPSLAALGEDETRRRRMLVRRLREELRNEEMKLVLLKKVRQSQLLKESLTATAAAKVHPVAAAPPAASVPRGGGPPPPLVRGSPSSTPQPQAANKALTNHHHHHHHHHYHMGGSTRSPADLSRGPTAPSSQPQLPPPLVGGMRPGATTTVAGMLLQHQQQQQQQAQGALLRGATTLAPSSLAGALSRPAAAHGSPVGYGSAVSAHQGSLQPQQQQQPQQQATSLSSSSPVPTSDGQTPAQRQAAAKLALRKQLEKTLLQIPPPKPPPPEMHFVPNANNPEFVYLLGLETVVTFLTEGEMPPPPPPTPFSCLQCGLDFTPVWKWQDVRGAGSARRPPVICEACVTSNIKKALKAEHTHRLKTAFVKALQQEQEIEQRLAGGGAPSPPPASTPPPAAHSPRLGGGGASTFLPKLTPQQLLQAQQLHQLAQSLPPPQPAHMLPFAPLLAAYSYQMLGGKAPSAELQRQYLLDMIPPRSMAQGSVNWKT